MTKLWLMILGFLTTAVALGQNAVDQVAPPAPACDGLCGVALDLLLRLLGPVSPQLLVVLALAPVVINGVSYLLLTVAPLTATKKDDAALAFLQKAAQWFAILTGHMGLGAHPDLVLAKAAKILEEKGVPNAKPQDVIDAFLAHAAARAGAPGGASAGPGKPAG